MTTSTCKRKNRQTIVGRNIWRQDHSLSPGLVRFALFNLAFWFNTGNTVCETFTKKVRSVHTAAALIKNAKPIPMRTNKLPRTTHTRKKISTGLRSSVRRTKTFAANFAKPTTYTSDFWKHRLPNLTFQTESKIIPSKPLPKSPSSLLHTTQNTQARRNPPHYVEHVVFEAMGKKYTTILAFLEKTEQQAAQSW